MKKIKEFFKRKHHTVEKNITMGDPRLSMIWRILNLHGILCFENGWKPSVRVVVFISLLIFSYCKDIALFIAIVINGSLKIPEDVEILTFTQLQMITAYRMFLIVRHREGFKKLVSYITVEFPGWTEEGDMKNFLEKKSRRGMWIYYMHSAQLISVIALLILRPMLSHVPYALIVQPPLGTLPWIPTDRAPWYQLTYLFQNPVVVSKLSITQRANASLITLYTGDIHEHSAALPLPMHGASSRYSVQQAMFRVPGSKGKRGWFVGHPKIAQFASANISQSQSEQPQNSRGHVRLLSVEATRDNFLEIQRWNDCIMALLCRDTVIWKNFFAISVAFSMNMLFFTLTVRACAHLDCLARDLESLGSQSDSHQTLVKFVDRYNKIREFTDLLNHLFFALTAVQPLYTGVSVITSLLVFDGTEQSFSFAGIAIAHMLELFIYCYAGDLAAEKSCALADKLFGCRWYELSQRDKRSVLQAVQQCQKPFNIRAGFFGNFSRQMFTTTMKTTYSTWAVINQAK